MALAITTRPIPASAAVVWTHDDYWGVNTWQSTNLLAPTTLSLETADGNVRISWPFISPDAGGILQTTINLPPVGGWTEVTNEAMTSYVEGIRSISMPANDPQRFFRLVAMQTNWIPVFSFAVFYDAQLEFTQTAPLTVSGRTHANGPICMGAASGNVLRFNDTVTTASSIVVSNLGGYSSFATPVYAGTPTQRIGTPPLKPSGLTNHHALIEMPPVGESPLSLQWQQRYYNKAAVVLLISNYTVTVNVKSLGAADSTGIVSNYNFSSYSNIYFPAVASIGAERTNLARRLPFLSLTNRFYDYRESKWVMPTEINMAILKTWLVTNSMVINKFPWNAGSYPNIMYVGDFRTITNLHALRLTAGVVIPTNAPTSAGRATGFTIATINPLYLWGDYNCPNPAHLGTTNTTAAFPASLVSDAVTILSTNWTDSVYGKGSTTLNSRTAADVTVNAALISGVVYTTGTGVGYWSGGVQNQTRLLENWTGRTLTLNGSLVNLYPSAMATNQFQNPGVYYNAPTRKISFNPNFLDPVKLPPGTPLVISVTPAQ